MIQIQASNMMEHHGLPMFHSTTTLTRHSKQSRQHHTPCATQASPPMADDEPRALSDHSGSVTTASEASETSPPMSQGRGSGQDETHGGTVASPRRGLDSELERQHRQYAPEMLQQWACQDLKFERDEEYSLSQIQAYEAQPSQQSARVRDEYKLYNNDNNELPNTWMHDSQICLQAIPWRPSHPMQGTHDRRNPPLAYHSDTFGLNTTMADVATPPDLPAYADPKPQQFPTIESSYTDLVTGASAYPFYQTTSDGLPGPGGDDRLFPYTEESGHHLMCAGREGPLPSMEPDPDPEDVRMDVDEDTKDDEVDSPRSKDPSDENKEPPYAKLIWQAFMSTPSRSMHLQQIYEWFRQNTDKADGSGTGWMNSIRHNLSMNKAFIKQNPKPAVINSDGGLSLDTNAGIDSRKSTEWVLDPKFYSGVQSTTRYRRSNGINRSRGTTSSGGGRGKGPRVAGPQAGAGGASGGAGIMGVVVCGGGGGAEGGSSSSSALSAASSARASAGRRGGHVAALNRKRNRAAEKQQQQQQQQSMAPMAATRDVSHNNHRFHHTAAAAAAMHPICDPQQLGKGAAAAAAAAGGGGFAYVDHQHHQHQHLGYPYHHHHQTAATTSSPFHAAADFLCGGAGAAGDVPAVAAVTRYEQAASDGRLLGTNYFTSPFNHHHHHHNNNIHMSDPPTPPASVVDHYVSAAAGSHPHHQLYQPKTAPTDAAAAYFDDMAAVAAVSHDGYPTLTPTAPGAGYMSVQQQQHDHRRRRQQHEAAYVGGVYEQQQQQPRTAGEQQQQLPPHAATTSTMYWDNDVQLADLSLDA